MKKLIFGLFSFLILIQSGVCQTFKEIHPSGVNTLRAPAYPLVTIDPYTSIWSFTDKLYEENVRHWTGTPRTLLGVLRVDGKSYRFMGEEEAPLDPVIYTADIEPWTGRYTEVKPADGWEKPSFDDTAWKEGKGAFGGGASISTRWLSQDIWIRREIMLNEDISTNNLVAKFSHADMLELYINGIRIVKTGTGTRGKMNVTEPLTSEVIKTLKKGRNVIAAHCFQVSLNRYVDFGLFKNTGIKKSFEQTAVQKSVNVMPTQTFYEFECGPVKLDLIFTSPLLMNDLALLSRPVNYITWQARSLDEKKHNVQIYFEASPEWAVNTIGQPMTAERLTRNELIYLKTGTVEQPVLAKNGDDMRIDWGYFYLTGKSDKSVTMSVGDPTILKKEFALNGKLSNSFDNSLIHKMYQKMPALSYSREFGKVGKKVIVGHIMVGYDDILAIQYFGDNLPAYWKKDGSVDIRQAFEAAENNYSSVIEKCSLFDKQMMTDAESAGGKKYAEMCALTYRQSIAAHKLVKGKDGELLFFSKENNSGGFIATVDVTYPSSPLYLLYNPDLLKGMLNGIFYFSESGKYTKPFAAHDLGKYPLVNGQNYNQEGMPVEESGNMLILTTATVMEGNAAYAEKHWITLSTWANYLLENGLDPANQLCTDDFAGHLAHNANLSVKAILGIACYGKLAGMLGKNDIAVKYLETARKMAIEWIRLDDEADHFRLAFDRPDTWSQKYNLVWNSLLKLHIFPDTIAEKEVAYYLTKQLPYGLPIDSRMTYTKSDWVIWTATLASDIETFKKFTDPIWKYCNETQTRIPVSDWHETTDGKSVGFRARSVVGGYFMKMLEQGINRKQKGGQ
jgi:hypothetical protein